MTAPTSIFIGLGQKYDRSLEEYDARDNASLMNRIYYVQVKHGHPRVVYLAWSRELLIPCIGSALFVGVALLIACQIDYYATKSGHAPLKSILARHPLLIKRLKFAENYVILLTGSAISGLALYYVFELTKSHSWAPKLIGTIIPTSILSISFIPQIVLVCRTKSAVGYSLVFIITDLLGASFGVAAVCLQKDIDVVPMISLLVIIIYQLSLLVLKVCVYPGKADEQSEASSTCETYKKPTGESRFLLTLNPHLNQRERCCRCGDLVS